MAFRKVSEELIALAGVYPTVRNIYHRLLNGDEWARRLYLQEFTRQFLKAGDLVFDVGANQGRWTEVYQRLGGNVVAIEPNPDLARLIELRYRPAFGSPMRARSQFRGGGASSRLGRWPLGGVAGVDRGHPGTDIRSSRWRDAARVRVETFDERASDHRMSSGSTWKVENQAFSEACQSPSPSCTSSFQCAHLKPFFFCCRSTGGDSHAGWIQALCARCYVVTCGRIALLLWRRVRKRGQRTWVKRDAKGGLHHCTNS